MNIARKVTLVAGATGVIGRGIVEHLAGLDDREVVSLFRIEPEGEGRARHVPVDPLDPEGRHKSLQLLCSIHRDGGNP